MERNRTPTATLSEINQALQDSSLLISLCAEECNHGLGTILIHAIQVSNTLWVDTALLFTTAGSSLKRNGRGSAGGRAEPERGLIPG